MLFFNGWSRKIPEAGGCGIHHPKGDIKKISTYDIVPITNSNCVGLAKKDDYWEIKWKTTANGHSVMQPGSSGSPLFNSNHLIIGQLYGPYLCDDIQCDEPSNQRVVYGKFSKSWNSSSFVSERLQPWLDPQNINSMDHSGGYLEPCIQSSHSLNHSYYPNKTILAIEYIISGDVSEPHAKVEMQAGQFINLTNGFHAKNSSDFTAKIANCVPRVVLKMANLLQSSKLQNSNLQPLFSVYPNPSKNITTLKLENIKKG